jgi:hypothetical protein
VITREELKDMLNNPTGETVRILINEVLKFHEAIKYTDGRWFVPLLDEVENENLRSYVMSVSYYCQYWKREWELEKLDNVRLRNIIFMNEIEEKQCQQKLTTEQKK